MEGAYHCPQCPFATVAFTLDVYGHVDEQMQKDSANQMQAFLETLCSGN